ASPPGPRRALCPGRARADACAPRVKGGTERARGKSSRPPGGGGARHSARQAASTRAAAAAPAPPPALASELADCAAGRSRAEPGGGGGRAQRAGVSRVPSASPGARALAQPSSPPPFFPKALGGATLRPEPGTAQPPTFNVPHSPARASSASFPSPSPSCLHFPRKGFSLSLPHTVAARERAGRAAEFPKK
ncbi:hypothetical protein MC885_020627, partial [Smutsia gigantea]